MLKKIINRIKRIKYKTAIAPKSIEKRFSNIYSFNLWFKNGQSRSGSGSTLEATSRIRSWLEQILSDLKANNLTDVGCGDFYWMKEVNLPCEYIGLDIVSEIIELNRSSYEDVNLIFKKHNAVIDELPKEADVVLCREVLFHLSFEDGIKMIKNIFESNARFLIITSSNNTIENKNIRTGEFRNLNLKLPPFNFPKSIEAVQDSQTVSNDRYLNLWDINELRNISFGE